MNLAVGTAYADDAPASVKVFNVSDVSLFGSFLFRVFLTYLTIQWASPDISQWSRFEETLTSLQGSHHVGK